MSLFSYPHRYLVRRIPLVFLFGWLPFHGAYPQCNPPTLSSISPTQGPVGTVVTIIGRHFNPTPAENVVYFGATRATVLVASETTLDVVVPIGATYQPIAVTTAGCGLTAFSHEPFLPTFPCGGSLSESSFALQASLALGDMPYSGYGLAIGELDGDGKADLIAVNKQSNSLSVLRNTGTQGSPSFASRLDFPVGSSPFRVAIGDLDGDGQSDLVAVNKQSNQASILRNISTPGNLSFEERLDLDTGPNPQGVAVGELDGDGRLDLVVTSREANLVSVLRNLSTPTQLSFTEKQDFSTGPSPLMIALGDVDGDGRADLVTANFEGSSVSLLLNQGLAGQVAFADRLDVDTGSYPTSVSLGDVDGDGRLDILVTSIGTNTLGILRNTGSAGHPSFAERLELATEPYPLDVAWGDVDGDGRPDLAIANFGSNSASVLRNTSSPGSPSFDAKLDFPSEIDPYSIALGDIDGDRKPDVLVANNYSSSVTVLHNTLAAGLSFTSLPAGTVNTSNRFCDDGVWKDFYDPAQPEHLICSIRDNGQSLGAVQASVYVDIHPGVYQGVACLSRHYMIRPAIQPASGSSVEVRLYFTDAEWAALQALDGSLATVNDLGLTKYQGPTEDGVLQPSDATALDFLSGSQISYSRTLGGIQAQFSVDGFSEFWFSGSTIPLPIRLLEFTARASGESVILSWITASQTDNAFFTVERSADGITFDSIEEVAGALTTRERLSYHATDDHPLGGTSYYRLRQTDTDGHFSYSKLESVHRDAASAFRLFPNPFSDQVTIAWQTGEDAQLELYDAVGKLVRSYSLSGGSATVTRRGLPNGIYYFRFRQQGLEKERGKLVIQ